MSFRTTVDNKGMQRRLLWKHTQNRLSCITTKENKNENMEILENTDIKEQ